MGMFDSVVFNDKAGNEVEMQFKSGECILKCYDIGAKVEDMNDGIHFCHEGAFVIYEGVIVAAFSNEDKALYNKWGGRIKDIDILAK